MLLEWLGKISEVSVLNDGKVPDKVKAKLHKTIVRPPILYGLEKVTLT
jgi:hypothetical protein